MLRSIRVPLFSPIDYAFGRVAFLESVVADYAEVPHPYGGTLGSQADGYLFSLRNLQVGMVAPDIEGDDLDGVAFKLSDYRGKVVVLDFWGHW